jgi:2-beta-glucuronyltransferase
MNGEAAVCPQRRVLLFTQQFVGLGTRKTGMVFWAETFARLGWSTFAVTTQLSQLSALLNPQRLAAVAPSEVNRWVPRGPNLTGFVWVPAVHPVAVRSRLVNAATSFLGDLYARSLPVEIRRIAAQADVIVLESCAAVALFERLKDINPHARIVYCASDRLGAVGMHPTLQRRLQRTAVLFDLIRVPSQSMAGDFPAGSRVAHIGHGVDKAALDARHPSPFTGNRPAAIVGGDMAFDEAIVRHLVEAFPVVDFHFFGRMDLRRLAGKPNVVIHGEVPFASLVPFMQHADIGIAPYLPRPELDYLAQSSLKLHQYTYCRLPTLAPAFARDGRAHIIPYDPSAPGSAVAALESALRFDRTTIDRGSVSDWDDVIHELVERLDGLPSFAPLPVRKPLLGACGRSGSADANAKPLPPVHVEGLGQ